MIYEYKDLKIHYEIFEDSNLENKKQENPPLLLLHGWMAKIEAMAPIYQFFKYSRKVIVLDFPGQGGKSDTLKEVWGVPEYAEMVKSLLDAIAIEKCDVIGHSFGGRVILYLGAKYPQLFRKIVLTDAAGVKPKINLQKQCKIYGYKMTKFICKLLMSKERYEKKVEEMRQKRGSADYAALTSDIMRMTFQKIIHLDLTPKLKEIKQPTLLVWGEKDQDTPLYMARIMEKRIPDSGVVVLENAGHFSYLDQTQKYLVIVSQFLDS